MSYQYNKAKYRYELWESIEDPDNAGEYIFVKAFEYVDIKDISFGFERNVFKDCTLVIEGGKLAPEVLAKTISGNELRIYRQGSFNNSLKLAWAGEIQNAEKTIDNNGYKFWSISVKAWGNVFLENRFVNLDFLQEDEGDIAKAIIYDIQHNLHNFVEDRFNTDDVINTDIWFNNDPDYVKQNDGVLTFTTQLAGAYISIGTRGDQLYNFTNKAISIQLVNPGNLSLSSYQFYPLVMFKDSSNQLFFMITGTHLYSIKKVSGSDTTVNDTTFDPDIHRFFRIRISSTTAYWEVSANRAHWTVLHSEATPITVTSALALIQQGSGAEASTTIAKVDNFYIEGVYTPYQVDWGITEGTIDTTSNVRDRTYVDDQALKILQQLANVRDTVGNPQRLRGFRLTPDLIDDSYNEFSYEVNYGTDRTSEIIYTSPLIKTVKEIDSLNDYANRVTANGSPNTAPQTAYSTDATELAKYKLRHIYVSKTNVETPDALMEAAEEELQTRLESVTFYQVQMIEDDPYVGLYTTGDILTINYTDEEGFIVLENLPMYVFGIDISYNGEGVEVTSLTVAISRPTNMSLGLADKLANSINSTNDRISELEKQV